MRAKQPHTEGFIDRDGVKLHYEVYGHGEETMVFVPTWAMVHSRAFKAQVPYFSEHFRVVTYDPRGNGKSDRPDDVDAYRFDKLVEDVGSVLDAIAAKRAILFGHSISGLVATTYAALHPERVLALVSISAPNPHVERLEHDEPVRFDEEFAEYEGWSKFNRSYWRTDYADFCEFLIQQTFSDPHSSKAIEDGIAYAAESDGEMLAMTIDAWSRNTLTVDENLLERITSPALFIHGSDDRVEPAEGARHYAAITGGELQILTGVGHAPHGRYPAKVNLLVRDFLVRHLGVPALKQPHAANGRAKRVLYISSPIGLGHIRRDLAVARELRALRPDVQIEWLAQDPVTRVLEANRETVLPASGRLASESAHIEEWAGEHDLNAFQAMRDAGEISVANFMTFQEVVEQDRYDLVIGDEAWDVDRFWHEHPELKRSQLAWFTDFVGFLPMPEDGERGADLTADYNAEMVELVERNPDVRDRALFVGDAEDLVPLGMGNGLPTIRDWVPQHFDFTGYILGEHPATFGDRHELRARFGYRDDEKVCLVTVGGSGVGTHLIGRIAAAYPAAKRRVPQLRMIIVTGPRIDPASLGLPDDIETRAFVPDLDRHLAACDLAIVQGGLSTCMELTAAGTPFIYFPLRHHFEQSFHVPYRLDRYGAGRRMDLGASGPDEISAAIAGEIAGRPRYKEVSIDGAKRAAAKLAEML